MKKISITVVLLLLCFFALLGCGTDKPSKTSETTKTSETSKTSETPKTSETTSYCEHEWKKTGDYSVFAVHLICIKCGEDVMYTDPEVVPHSHSFSGSVSVHPAEKKEMVTESLSEELLGVLNRAYWQKSFFPLYYDYVLTINGNEILYDSFGGVLAVMDTFETAPLDCSDSIKMKALLDAYFEGKETSSVFVKIKKWNENGFEGIIGNSLSHYTDVICEKVFVKLNGDIDTAKQKYPEDSFVSISVDCIDSSKRPDEITAKELAPGIIKVCVRINTNQNFPAIDEGFFYAMDDATGYWRIRYENATELIQNGLYVVTVQNITREDGTNSPDFYEADAVEVVFISER